MKLGTFTVGFKIDNISDVSSVNKFTSTFAYSLQHEATSQRLYLGIDPSSVQRYLTLNLYSDFSVLFLKVFKYKRWEMTDYVMETMQLGVCLSNRQVNPHLYDIL